MIEKYDTVNVHIFLLCYNEEILLPKTINHYRTLFPNCKITIYDNESTDKSREISEQNNCEVITYKTGNKIDDLEYLKIKNNCWKSETEGWIIMADMDEWLYITEKQLLEEQDSGTTILSLDWYDIFIDGMSAELTDVNLETVDFGYLWNLGKNICFYRKKISEMNYDPGAHTCNPEGEIVYSNKTYLVKHMHYLSMPFYINKIKARAARNKENIKKGFGIHYISDEEDIKIQYNKEKEKVVKIQNYPK